VSGDKQLTGVFDKLMDLNDGVWVGVGFDHTDRELEIISVSSVRSPTIFVAS
jgi:hypothetical protein